MGVHRHQGEIVCHAPKPARHGHDAGNRPGSHADAGGIPTHGNQRAGWEAGCRFDYGNPDYRQGGTGTAMTMDGACGHRAGNHG
jgi:hypothetical protein